VHDKRPLNIATQIVYLATFSHLYSDPWFIEFLHLFKINDISDAFTNIFILQLCLLYDCLQKEIT